MAPLAPPIPTPMYCSHLCIHPEESLVALELVVDMAAHEHCGSFTDYMYMYMREYFYRAMKNRHNHPGSNRGSLTLAVSALLPELWPPGDSQPSQLSISLRMCHQNPARDRVHVCTVGDVRTCIAYVHVYCNM